MRYNIGDPPLWPANASPLRPPRRRANHKLMRSYPFLRFPLSGWPIFRSWPRTYARTQKPPRSTICRLRLPPSSNLPYPALPRCACVPGIQFVLFQMSDTQLRRGVWTVVLLYRGMRGSRPFRGVASCSEDLVRTCPLDWSSGSVPSTELVATCDNQ